MSDPTLSDIDFKNKMAWVWTTLKIRINAFETDTASLSTKHPELMKILIDSLDDTNPNKIVVSLLILRQCRQSRHYDQMQELTVKIRNLFKSKVWRVRSLAAETFYNLRILPTKVRLQLHMKINDHEYRF